MDSIALTFQDYDIVSDQYKTYAFPVGRIKSILYNFKLFDLKSLAKPIYHLFGHNVGNHINTYKVEGSPWYNSKPNHANKFPLMAIWIY